MKELSPIGWAIRPLKRYAQFSGRSSRAEFWWFFLFLMILYVVVWIGLFAVIGISAAAAASPQTQSPLEMIGAFGVLGVFMVLFWLVLFIPTLALQIRRLHDTDRSGWWLGGFWLLYLVYIGLSFGTLFSLRASPDSAPSVTGLGAAIGIIGLVFFVYSIMLLVFWCFRGTKGANRFGDDPYGANVEEVFA